VLSNLYCGMIDLWGEMFFNAKIYQDIVGGGDIFLYIVGGGWGNNALVWGGESG